MNIIDETGELIENCATNHEAGFVRGLFKDQFDPQRLALLPPKEATTNHSIWTRYLNQDIRRAITTNFDKNFTGPIIKGIEEAKSLPEPRCYCQEGKYVTVVDRMNHAGLLKWRLEDVRETRLSNYTKQLQIIPSRLPKACIKIDLYRGLESLTFFPPHHHPLTYQTLPFLNSSTTSQAT